MRARVEDRTFFPWDVKEPLMKETDGRCAHCGTPLDRYGNMTVEHVIPLSKGGTNDPANLTVLCGDCNLLKADQVLHAGWYPYLPKNRRKELTEHLRTYMKETDYLAEDCLIPVDMFRIEVPIEFTKKNRRIRMPAYIHGSKMTRDDAFAWLVEYGKSLPYRDQCGMLKDAREFMAPCYLLKKGDIQVAMANPWMIHEYDRDLKTYRNEILIDWFFHPGLPERDYLPEMLSWMVCGLETYIANSISMTMEGACTALFRQRCFVGDKWCSRVFDKMKGRRNDDVTEFDTGHTLKARIRELTCFHVMGQRDACRELMEKLDAKNPDKMMDMHEAMKVNSALNKRFEGDRNENK